MARRAGYIKSMLQADGETDGELRRSLLLAGPQELISVTESSNGKTLDPALAKAFLEAFRAMDHDRVYLTADEAAEFAAVAPELMENGELPAPFKAISEKPSLEYFQVNGLAIGVIALPPRLLSAERPETSILKTVNDLATEAAAQADLVLCVSSWPKIADTFLLDKVKPPIDLLLGASSAHPLMVSGSLRTLKIRSDYKGRVLTRVDILALPEGPERAWDVHTHAQAQLVALDEKVPFDPEVDALFAPLRSH